MTPINRRVMLGESPLILDLMDQVSRIAPLNKPVLVLGERGTGKELVAERIHFLSRRWDQMYLKVNCASMNESLLESELFGHETGAFTGATKRHLGRFERAEKGTLFLDELATSSLQIQEKLLRVVEYGEFERVGGQTVLQADVRLIAATNENLQSLVEAKQFRADLLDRLAFDVIHIPPLRYRQEDILILAEHFALSMCHELGRGFFPGFSDHAFQQMMDYDWPGNVRELRNAVERSIYRQEDDAEPIASLVIDPFVVPWSVGAHDLTEDVDSLVGVVEVAAGVGSLVDQVDGYQQKLILDALQISHFNQKIAAEKLGLTYHQLRAQLKKFKMLPLKRYLNDRNLEMRGVVG